jgi:hypothetical protein
MSCMVESCIVGSRISFVEGGREALEALRYLDLAALRAHHGTKALIRLDQRVLVRSPVLVDDFESRFDLAVPLGLVDEIPPNRLASLVDLGRGQAESGHGQQA